VTEYADLGAVVRQALAVWRPPPRLTLSEWADEHFYLSAESAAEPGRWKTLPYQKGIMDAITDPRVTQVSVMKSARVGYTKCMNAAIGYYVDQAPCSILVVQPTLDDAKGYSKEEISPMLRDCPRLVKIMFDDEEEIAGGQKDSANTILHKSYPGGVLSMVGANSGTGFRRVSRKVVIFDEVDGYPPSAGQDGDPIKLGIKRSEYFWDRKIIAGSTPLLAGASRIETLFEAGDQRRFYVPCPQCGHMAPLVFRGEHGHEMRWPDGKPDDAFFSCQKNGCVIEHKDKRGMVSRGQWRAAAPFADHASFHIWAAYSFSPNATWAQLAREFLECKDNPERLKTYVNTVLGETWKERGEAPDWERLYQRRQPLQPGTTPTGVRFITAGVDVQKDRFVYEVVGWGAGKESWSLEAAVLPADTSNEADWAKLDELLNRSWADPSGRSLAVLMLAVDSGYNTQTVYNWVRRHSPTRVIATKGVHTQKSAVGTPTPVDVTFRGQRIPRGCKVWPLGTGVLKSELYGWLKLPTPAEGHPYPDGYCHFPEYGEDFFKQLTGEHMVAVVNKRTRFTIHEWQLIPGRENHYLDCRVYARAAAAVVGLDRMQAPPKPVPSKPVLAPNTRIGPDGAFELSDDPKVRALEERLSSPPLAPKPKQRQTTDSRFWSNRGKSGWFKR
jgi:phage terminase large subunit GpA-like protein